MSDPLACLRPDQRQSFRRFVDSVHSNPHFGFHAIVAEDPRILADLLARAARGLSEESEPSSFEDGPSRRSAGEDGPSRRSAGEDGPKSLQAALDSLDARYARGDAQSRVVVVSLAGITRERYEAARDFIVALAERRALYTVTLRGALVIGMPAWFEPILFRDAPYFAAGLDLLYLERTPPRDHLWIEMHEWWRASVHYIRATKPDHFRDGTLTIARVFEPGSIEGSIEQLDAWEDEPPSVYRLSTAGASFHRQGYPEDIEAMHRPFLSEIVAIRRIAEELLQTRSFAAKLGLRHDPWIAFRIEWTGLRGRELVDWPGCPTEHGKRPACLESDDAIAETSFDLGVLYEDLPAVVECLLEPLYQRFELYQPPPGFIEAEVAKVVGHA